MVLRGADACLSCQFAASESLRQHLAVFAWRRAESPKVRLVHRNTHHSAAPAAASPVPCLTRTGWIRAAAGWPTGRDSDRPRSAALPNALKCSADQRPGGGVGARAVPLARLESRAPPPRPGASARRCGGTCLDPGAADIRRLSTPVAVTCAVTGDVPGAVTADKLAGF